MISMCDTAVRASRARFLVGQACGSAAGEARSLRLLARGARLCRVALLALGAGLMMHATVAVADGDAAAGAEKAHTCLGCHGVQHYVNTYPTFHVPRIAGQNREYLVAALHAYRDQTRSHPTMQANAGLLTDQDIEDIAAWLAAQGSK